MQLYTREQAAALIDASEGQVIDDSKPDARGHAYVHVGPPKAPIIDQPWRRKLTTMYRNRTQAEKDLRDLLNRHIPELNALANGTEITFRDIVSTPRQVHVAKPAGEKYSYAGSAVTNTTRQELFVKIIKTQAGGLHLRTMFLTE